MGNMRSRVRLASIAGEFAALLFLAQGTSEAVKGAGAFTFLQIALSAASALYFLVALLRNRWWPGE